MKSLASLMGMLMAVALMSCGTTRPETTAERTELHNEAEVTLERFKAEVPNLGMMLQEAHGYVVFPGIAKGGFVVGGARGQGVVYEQGRIVGYARMSQATLGAQVGGQAYSELILFRDKQRMEEFKTDEYEPTGQVSAVAVTAGAGEATNWEDGVRIFTMTKSGLMGEAALGAQRFEFVPID